MGSAPGSTTPLSARTLHWLGPSGGCGPGAWLGAAEAPTKLVTAGFSPFIISVGMVAGVFFARWTVPLLLQGTGSIWVRLQQKEAPLGVGHPGRHIVGSGQHAHRVRHPQRRSLCRFSFVEHQQPGGLVLGLAAVQRVEELRGETM